MPKTIEWETGAVLGLQSHFRTKGRFAKFVGNEWYPVEASAITEAQVQRCKCEIGIMEFGGVHYHSPAGADEPIGRPIDVFVYGSLDKATP